MKLYLLSQNTNNDYDTYDSCLVAAESEEIAKTIMPDGDDINSLDNTYFSDWVTDVKDVRCEYIGEAKEGTEQGVVIASFNAG